MKNKLFFMILFFCASILNAQNNYDNYLKRAYSLLEEGQIEKAQQAYNVYKEMSNQTDSQIESLLNNKTPTSGYESGHEWVDFGLSVKWATCNVGAAKPEDYGDYYAWGEVLTKSNYTWTNYRFRTSGDSWRNVKFNKYNISSSHGSVDNKTKLDIADDVAYIKWGDNWRMPTQSELQELIDYCIWTWTTQNGVNGYRVTGIKSGYTDCSIFLPANGYRGDNLISAGIRGYYWSSSLDTHGSNQAWGISIDSDSHSINDTFRYLGRSVRPVYP